MANNGPKKCSSCGHQALVSVQNQHLLKFFLFLCIVRNTFRNATSNSHKMIFLPHVRVLSLYLGSRNHQSNLRLQLKALLTPVGYKSCLKIYILSLSSGIATIIVIIIILTVNVGTGTLVRNCSLYQVNDLIQKVQHLSQDISCTKQR